MSVSLPEPSRLPPDARFDIGPERYSRMHRFTNVPIRMRDGAVLFADLTRPGDITGPTVEPLPVIVNFTPYNKNLSRPPAPIVRFAAAVARWVGPSDRRRFTGRDLFYTLAGGALAATTASPTLIKRGYAYLMVDVRGTGSSTGAWEFFGPTEQQDYFEVLRWVREQPWCNDKIGITGISYNALAALIVAGRRPDGLEAVFAMAASEDAVRELGLTGGVLSPFIAYWLLFVNLLKWIPAWRGLMRAGMLRRYLRDRLTAPACWLGRAAGIALRADHPDCFLNEMWAGKLARLSDITVPIWLHGAWHDVYNRSIIRMYDRIATPPGAKQAVIDDGYHVSPGSGFGAPDRPQHLDELQCAWFDRWIKGIDNGIDRFGPITLWQQGSGWVSCDRFPDPAATARRRYLNPAPSGGAPHAGIDGSLTDTAPDVEQRMPLPSRRGSIASNNTAIISTGFATVLGRSFGSDDRRAEATAITFTTEPLAADLVLSGPLNLHLYVEADGTDAFWSVTVSDVEPDGASAVLTRGALLSSLRAVDEAASRYIDGELVVAEHSLTADSVRPVVPHEPHVLDIDINATAAVLRAGHRLRVSVARSSFPRHLPSLGQHRRIKSQAIVVHPACPSYLTFLAAMR